MCSLLYISSSYNLNINLVKSRPDCYRLARYGAVAQKYIIQCKVSQKSDSAFCARCRLIWRRRLHLKRPCSPIPIRLLRFNELIPIYHPMIKLPKWQGRHEHSATFSTYLLIDFINCSWKYVSDKMPTWCEWRVHYKPAHDFNTNLDLKDIRHRYTYKFFKIYSSIEK